MHISDVDEADVRLAAGWHVNLPEPGPMCSAQRKRYWRLERERLLASAANAAQGVKS